MPTQVRTLCREPGCPRPSIGNGHCSAHNRAYDRARGTATARGYGADWRRLRLRILERDPHCMEPGCFAPSTDADHITARRKGGSDDPANLRGICHSHHSSKTATKDGRWR